MSTTDTVRRPQSRLWTIENRAGPANAPKYQGTARAGSPSWTFGDRTAIREPSDSQYSKFNTVDAIKAERDLPSLPIVARYKFTVSDFLRLARIGCEFDVQVHMGKCQDPRDFNGGWDKVLVLEGADITSWSPDELGALEQGEDAVVNENVDINGLDAYEVVQLSFAEIGGSEVVQEVVDIVICDSIQCGECGVPSDGCQVFFALTLTAGGSPGLAAEIIFSQNGGTTLGQTSISTLAADEDPDEMACVGVNLVVVSNESCSVHYAPIADILTGTETWVEIATGLTCAAGAPNAISSLGAAFTWIVGDGGYIYFSEDITAGVTNQDAGVATTENLNAVHALDNQNVVAVGANNAVVRTTNGGETWQTITGPAVGVVLNTIFMKSALEWFIGDAGGQLWYTRDGGTTWTEKTFPGSGGGEVRHVTFANPTVGYMAHDLATPAGRILRTINGGYSWYVLPEGTGAIPGNDRISMIAACTEDANVLFAGGLGDDASDGIIVKAA